MSWNYDEFWALIPERAFHPHRVPILEAFRCIGEPLSPVMVVDVLEGEVTMWEAVAHLDALVRLGVVRRGRRDPQAPSLREGRFDLFYSLALGD